MPSSWSPSLRFELQFTGENINLWGEKLNAALSRADYAIAGWLTKPLTGHATLSAVNDGVDEARAAMIRFTGTLAEPATVSIPAVSKTYLVWNAADRVVTITAGGTSVPIDPGDIVWVACDGANVRTPGYGGLSIKDYVAAAGFSAVELPAQAANAGKYLKTDGTSATWQAPSVADLADYQTAIKGLQVALAVAL
ncbi:hypothetical protein [Phenylobacterium sp.]|uniref:hypothetical protein n=1 Tax=Phenylobacterium sp. TaxID=1871053 RepID=UPI003BA84251